MQCIDIYNAFWVSQSLPSTDNVKNEWSYASTSPVL